MKRVLAFFGAFNPPTVAHIELGRFAMAQTGREGVIYVPSKSVYIRGEQGKDFAYGERRRLEMLEAAARTRPWMAVSDIEFAAETQPRTYDSLCRLRDEGYEPALLMGSDKLAELQTVWRHVEDIGREFGFVCMTRGADECEKLLREDAYLSAIAQYFTIVATPESLRDVSSTAVRQKLSQIRALKREVAGLVPEEILKLL